MTDLFQSNTTNNAIVTDYFQKMELVLDLFFCEKWIHFAHRDMIFDLYCYSLALYKASEKRENNFIILVMLVPQPPIDF